MSSDSGVSKDGIPDAELKYIIDSDVLKVITERRAKRRMT